MVLNIWSLFIIAISLLCTNSIMLDFTGFVSINGFDCSPGWEALFSQLLCLPGDFLIHC